MPVNYKNSKIYKLVSAQTDKIYIGSTAQKYLSTRLQGHIKDFKAWMDGHGEYTTSFELFEFDDVKIRLIESYPCDNVYELRGREEYWIQQFKDICVNRNSAFGIDKEKRKASIKKFRQTDKHKKYEREYRQSEKRKEWVRKYSHTKKFKENNKKFKQSAKYKEWSRNYKKKQIECNLCGYSVRRGDFSRHRKTLTHKQNDWKNIIDLNKWAKKNLS